MVDIMQLVAVPPVLLGKPARPGEDRAASPSQGLPGYPQSAFIQHAHAFWLQHCDGAEMPSWASIDGPAFDPLRSQSILFELVREPLDFRYAEIGSRMQDISNGDYTGRLLSELPHQRPPSKVWDHLSGAFDARAPVKGVLPYVGRSRDIGAVFHIVMPLADDGRTVDRLLTCVDLTPAIRLADGTHPFSQLG